MAFSSVTSLWIFNSDIMILVIHFLACQLAEILCNVCKVLILFQSCHSLTQQYLGYRSEKGSRFGYGFYGPVLINQLKCMYSS